MARHGTTVDDCVGPNDGEPSSRARHSQRLSASSLQRADAPSRVQVGLVRACMRACRVQMRVGESRRPHRQSQPGRPSPLRAQAEGPVGSRRRACATSPRWPASDSETDNETNRRLQSALHSCGGHTVPAGMPTRKTKEGRRATSTPPRTNKSWNESSSGEEVSFADNPSPSY